MGRTGTEATCRAGITAIMIRSHYQAGLQWSEGPPVCTCTVPICIARPSRSTLKVFYTCRPAMARALSITDDCFLFVDSLEANRHSCGISDAVRSEFEPDHVPPPAATMTHGDSDGNMDILTRPVNSIALKRGCVCSVLTTPACLFMRCKTLVQVALRGAQVSAAPAAAPETAPTAAYLYNNTRPPSSFHAPVGSWAGVGRRGRPSAYHYDMVASSTQAPSTKTRNKVVLRPSLDGRGELWLPFGQQPTCIVYR